MKYFEKMKTKTSFEIIFIATIGLSFLLWMIFMFLGGPSGNQFNIFFGRCGNFIADSSNVTGYSSGRDPYHNLIYGLGEKAYLPLTYVIMYFVSRIVNVDSYAIRDESYFGIVADYKYLAIFLIFIIIIMILMYTLIQVTKKGKMSIKIMTAMALCFSAPMIYSIERGNTIIFTVFLCMFYLFYYNSENKILKELALIALASAVGFKMTPALLGIMLLYNKQFKEAARAVLYGIIIVFGPFLFLHGGFSNIPLMFDNIALNLKSYTSLDGCTLTASVNRFGKFFDNKFTMTQGLVDNLKTITTILSLLLLVVVPFLKTNWEKVAAVVVVLIILPSHSGEYCVLYMLPVIVMFLNEEKHRNIDFLYLLCMIMISWDFVCKASEIFNYNLALPIMVVALLITGIINMIKMLQNRMLNGKGVGKNE